MPIQRPDDPERRNAASDPLKPDLVPRPEPPGTKIPGPPFWTRGQFKRYVGAILSVFGGALSLAYPPAAVLGNGLAMIGGLLFAGGIFDAAIKQKSGSYPKETVTAYLVEIAKMLYNIYLIWKEKRNARRNQKTDSR